MDDVPRLPDTDREWIAVLAELDASRKAHREARANLAQAVKACLDLGASHPEGIAGLKKANEVMSQATDRCHRAIAVFNEHCRKRSA